MDEADKAAVAERSGRPSPPKNEVPFPTTPVITFAVGLLAGCLIAVIVHQIVFTTGSPYGCERAEKRMNEDLEDLAARLVPNGEIYTHPPGGCEDTGQPSAGLEIQDPSWRSKADARAVLVRAKWFDRERNEFIKPTGNARAYVRMVSADGGLEGPQISIGSNSR